MRVVLDATGIGSGAGGDETLLRGLLGGLLVASDDDDRFVVAASAGAALPDGVQDDPRFEVRRLRRGPGAIHFAASLPRLVEQLRPAPDLVFSAIHGPLWGAVPLALMVQDLSFEHRRDDYPLSTRMRLVAGVRTQVRTSRSVLTISEHARSDLIGTYRLDPTRVMHVPCAAATEERLEESEVRDCRAWLRSQGVFGPYVLYLGNLHPRKNVRMLIEGFVRAHEEFPSMAGHQLVVAGGRWWGTGEEETARAIAPEGSVVFLGRVDDLQREFLLRDAVALGYLSLFEGFGLPPLEAMSRGTPVIVSNRTSVPEVVGDAGLVVDPLDVAAVATAMGSLTSDRGLRDDLITRGRDRAAQYSFEATGAALHRAFTTSIQAPWEGSLDQRSAGILQAIGLSDELSGVRVADLTGTASSEQERGLVELCRSLDREQLAIVRLSHRLDRLGSMLANASSAGRLWRLVESHGCAVLEWWTEARAVVVVLRRLDG